jgi:hypothetical protein
MIERLNGRNRTEGFLPCFHASESLPSLQIGLGLFYLRSFGNHVTSLINAGTRLLIRLCQARPLDFADFAIPDNALEGALEHLLNTNDHRAHSLLLELLGSLGNRGEYRLAALSVDLLNQTTFPSMK